jgi:hypothetical protein
MAKSLRDNVLFSLLVNDPDARFENIHEWNEDRYDLECKAKIDLWVRKTIGDVKTTDATSQEDFNQRCISYGYDRQAAFYLDGTGATKFIIFGIAKKYPHKTFTSIFLHDDEIIVEARKKYEVLIDYYLELKVKGEINFNF